MVLANKAWGRAGDVDDGPRVRCAFRDWWGLLSFHGERPEGTKPAPVSEGSEAVPCWQGHTEPPRHAARRKAASAGPDRLLATGRLAGRMQRRRGMAVAARGPGPRERRGRGDSMTAGSWQPAVLLASLPAPRGAARLAAPSPTAGYGRLCKAGPPVPSAGWRRKGGRASILEGQLYITQRSAPVGPTRSGGSVMAALSGLARRCAGARARDTARAPRSLWARRVRTAVPTRPAPKGPARSPTGSR